LHSIECVVALYNYKKVLARKQWRK